MLTRPEKRRIERNADKPLYDQLADIQSRLEVMQKAKGEDFDTTEFIDLMMKEYPQTTIESFIEHLQSFLDKEDKPQST